MLFGEIPVGTTFVLPVSSATKPDDPNRTEQKCVFKKQGETEAKVARTFFKNLTYLVGRIRHFKQNEVVEQWNL